MGLFKTAATPAKVGGAAKKMMPAKAGAATKKVGTAKAAPRRRDEDDDDDAGDGLAIATGWAGAKKMQAEYSDFMARLSMKEEAKIIGFQDNEPFATIAQHWVTRGSGKKVSRMSVLCRGAKNCPLCGVGDQPKVSYLFNIVELTNGDPVHWCLEVGERVRKDIEKAAKHPRYAPLPGHFYLYRREGMKFNDTRYFLDVVKRASDIEELASDNGLGELNVPDWDEVDAVDRYTVEDAKKGARSIKEMKEIAAEMSSGLDDDDGDDD